MTWVGGLPEYVFDPSVQKYVPYFIEQDSNTITVHSKQYPLIFDKNDCSLSVYDNSFSRIFPGTPKVIGKEYWTVAVADTGSNNWTEFDALAIPCTYVTASNADDVSLTVTRTALQGELIVEYVKPKGKPLKISATFENLNPSWTNHKFRFVEKFVDVSVSDIDLESARLSNLSNNFSNFYNFDSIPNKVIQFGRTNLSPFDINLEQGWNDFQGVNVNVANSQLDIDFVYGRGINLLLPSQIMTIDPTFGFSSGNIYQAVTGSASGTSCTSPSSVSSSGRILKSTSGASLDCRLVSVEWDITSLPTGLTVTDTNIQDTPSSLQNPINCDYWSMESQPSTLSATNLWNDILDGTEFVSNDSSCTSASLFTLDLGSSADSDVQANEPSNWWAVGVSYDDMTRDGVQHRTDLNDLQLEVVYTTGSTTHTWNVTDELGLDESVSFTSGYVWNVTDELGLDESVSFMAGLVWSVTDELGLDESISFTSGLIWNVTDELGLDESISFMGALVWNVTDELGLDESVLFGLDAFTITDELGLDESVEFILTKQQFNAIKLFLNSAKNGTLGGIYAGTCDYINNYTMIGFYENGTMICHKFQ